MPKRADPVVAYYHSLESLIGYQYLQREELFNLSYRSINYNCANLNIKRA